MYEKQKLALFDTGSHDCGPLCRFYLCCVVARARERSDSVSTFRSALYFGVLYAGGYSGTLCWLLANILTECILWDILFGPVATLIGAVGTWLLRRNPYLAVLPPIAANMVIVPLVLKYAYMAEEGIPYLMLTVGVGEIVTCGVLGVLLYYVIRRYRKPLGFEHT